MGPKRQEVDAACVGRVPTVHEGIRLMTPVGMLRFATLAELGTFMRAISGIDPTGPWSSSVPGSACKPRASDSDT